MVLRGFKGWFNKSEEAYSKSYEYPNRVLFCGFIWVSVLFGSIILMATYPNLQTGIFPTVSWYFSVGSVIIYFLFIMPKYTMRFPYIATKVSREVNGTKMTMYKYDNKLFYSLGDIEIYTELDKKGIKFIDLKKNEFSKNEVDEYKLWDKLGESHKSFKEFE